MALAVDTTWLWQRYGLPQSTEGVDLHNRFWKQMVVYLGQQEDQGGAAWIKPDARRLAAGGKLGFGVGLRGKTGLEIGEATFDVQLFAPQQSAPEPIVTSWSSQRNRSRRAAAASASALRAGCRSSAISARRRLYSASRSKGSPSAPAVAVAQAHSLTSVAA